MNDTVVFITVLSSHAPARCPLERSVLWKLQLENLRNAVAELSAQEQELLRMLGHGGVPSKNAVFHKLNQLLLN